MSQNGVRPSGTRPAPEPALDEIRRLEAERYEAMLKADTANLAALFSDEAKYTHSDGSQDSKSEYLRKVQDGLYRYHSIEYGVDHIVSVGSAILVHGWMKADAEVHGAPRKLDNISLAVWGLDGSRWQLFAYVSTRLVRR